VCHHQALRGLTHHRSGWLLLLLWRLLQAELLRCS
jgi:hypothetical protein